MADRPWGRRWASPWRPVGPLAMLATDHLWIRIDPYVVVGHAAEWLIRFAVVAVLSALLLESREAQSRMKSGEIA